MNEKERALIMSYLYNFRVSLERSLSEMQSRIQCREVSETECLELALLKERSNTFNEISGHLSALLKLGGRQSGNTCLICGADIPASLQVCKACYKRYKGE